MGCSASRSTTLLTAFSDDHHQKPSSNSPFSDSPPPPWPVSRTLSLPTPLIHHPLLRHGDTSHLVSLTSSTYGSLVLVDPPISYPNPNKCQTTCDLENPSSPDSVINTWELMEGLDDFEFDFVEPSNKSDSFHSAMSNGSIKKSADSFELVEHSLVRSVKKSADSFELVDHSDSKPLWKHLSEESLLAKMDPNVVSSYRRAQQLGHKGTFSKAVVRPISSDATVLLGTEDKIVLYHTSLRGIRKTYENCCAVRMILKGFRVVIDERDISMDSAYKNELQGVLKGKKAFSLPQVFIRGKHVGGADEIKQLHEEGELEKLLEGFPEMDHGFVCENCGEAKFVPCTNCNGSRKIFEEDEGKLRRCPNCNENGLVRCPTCCS